MSDMNQILSRIFSSTAVEAANKRWPANTPSEAKSGHNNRMEYGLGYEHGMKEGYDFAREKAEGKIEIGGYVVITKEIIGISPIWHRGKPPTLGFVYEFELYTRQNTIKFVGPVNHYGQKEQELNDKDIQDFIKQYNELLEVVKYL